MKALTHIFGAGGCCARCGMDIPTEGLIRHPKQGEAMGVIESTIVPPTVYFVGKKDSNEPCSEVGK